MIRFACPNCQKGLKAPPDKGGMKTSCPACKTPVVVPAAEPEPPAMATASASPLPVAQPVPAPVKAVAITVPPTPSRPPRSEPIVRECRTWVEFLSALRDEDQTERHLDLGGPLLSEVRKRLNDYATFVPHHNAAGFGTRASITKMTEWCVYTVSVQAVFETRRLGSGEAAYSGWRLPTAPTDPAHLDVWDFRFRPSVGLSGRSESVLHATQTARSCEPCGGRGDAPCGACRGGRTVACPKCEGRGTVEGVVRTEQRQKACDNYWDTVLGRIHCRGGYLDGEVCIRCQGRTFIWYDHAVYGSVPCSNCKGHKQVQCPTCTGAGRSQCDKCRGGKQVVRYATLCRAFEPWARSATTAGSGGEPPVVDALSRLRAHQPLARFVTTDTPDTTMLDGNGVAGTARSLLEVIQVETTQNRRPGCLALEVGRATAVRVEYECGKHQHVAWLLGRDRIVHAPASPVTDALAEKLSRAAKDWRQERKKEAVALVREAVAMGEKDVFCRAALDAERPKLPPDLWSAATNPGVLGAVAEGIGKLFGKWFG